MKNEYMYSYSCINDLYVFVFEMITIVHYNYVNVFDLCLN